MDVLISENQLPKNAGVVVVILNNYDEFYQVLDYSFHILKCDTHVAYENYKNYIKKMITNRNSLYVCFIIKGQKYSEDEETLIKFYLPLTGVSTCKKYFDFQFNFQSSFVYLDEKDSDDYDFGL